MLLEAPEISAQPLVFRDQGLYLGDASLPAHEMQPESLAC